MNTVNIDMGFLGKVVLEELAEYQDREEGFTITHDGYTESGVRVNAVLDDRSWHIYPCTWNHAILIKI